MKTFLSETQNKMLTARCDGREEWRERARANDAEVQVIFVSTNPTGDVTLKKFLKQPHKDGAKGELISVQLVCYQLSEPFVTKVIPWAVSTSLKAKSVLPL